MYNTLTCTLKTKAISTIFSFNQTHKINYFKIYDDIHDCLNLDDTSGTTFLEKILSDSDGLQWYTDTLNSIDNALLQFQITEFSIKDSLLKKEISSIKKLRSYLKSTYLKRQKRTQESLAFNIIIKDFQAILDTTFNRNFKFSMPFFSKVDTFIKDHKLDSSTVANAIFSAYCLSNVDKVLVNLASIKKLSNETTTLSKQAQKFLLSFDPCSNLLRNPVNLQIKLAYFIDKFLHSLLLNTHAIDLEKVHLNLNMSFVCHYLDLDLNIPVINHRPFNYLDTDTINYDKSSNYPVDCVLKIYYQFKNHASKSSKMSSYEFWNAFINFQSTFKTLLECFNYNNTDFKTQKSILMYPLFNECSSFGEKLYRRSVPVLLSIFKDINNWFCSEAKNYLDFIPKQDLFKEFLDNILENSMLESRLLFLPVFLKSLESKMYKRLLTQQGSNPPLLRKKLENIVRFLRIETQDTLIDITESTNDIYSLYSHLDQLNTQLHHLSKDHSADSDIFYTQEELEDKQNQLLVKNCIELINYIFNNINSVKLGKIATKEVSSKQQDLTFNIIESHFFETIKQRSDFNKESSLSVFKDSPRDESTALIFKR